jgi:hypothetical protein
MYRLPCAVANHDKLLKVFVCTIRETFTFFVRPIITKQSLPELRHNGVRLLLQTVIAIPLKRLDFQDDGTKVSGWLGL